ncbi:VOC family protein [Streptomyces sp. WAC06614]|uniref:VOC family protein n=1 Tax=Streptomyces sp. WAC06614 TaxID=2487416 RepID=UPI0021AEA980|nr:VOC family protein [Streptomyces sp. WAC06614]
MSTQDVYGAPCWVSLMTRDLAGAQRFYGAVLGWTFRPTRLGEAFRVAELDGVPVAGVGALAGDLSLAVSWTPYFAVEDVEVAVSRIRERTGTVAVGPVSFERAGRGALAADPQGAVFGVWEGRILSDWRIGRGRAPAWLELRTRDAFQAAVFYGEVLDWASGRPGCCEASYENDQVVLRRDGETLARLDSGPVEEAAAEPVRRPRWHVHFQVPDLGAAVDAALALGGTVVRAADPDDPEGSVTLRDAEGGLFDLDAAGT